MVVTLSKDKTIEATREAAEDLIDDLRNGDIDRDEAQRRKDDILTVIEDIRTGLTDSDGQITTIET